MGGSWPLLGCSWLLFDALGRSSDAWPFLGLTRPHLAAFGTTRRIQGRSGAALVALVVLLAAHVALVRSWDALACPWVVMQGAALGRS